MSHKKALFRSKWYFEKPDLLYSIKNQFIYFPEYLCFIKSLIQALINTDKKNQFLSLLKFCIAIFSCSCVFLVSKQNICLHYIYTRNKKRFQIFSETVATTVSGYQDSNLGPPAPKAGALTGLRYTPYNTFHYETRKYHC